MPSNLPQFNARVSEEAIADIEAVMAAMREVLGIPVRQSDFLYAAIAEMKKRYPPVPRPAPAARRQRKPRGKP